MSQPRITYRTEYTNPRGLVQPIQMTVRASDAGTGAEIATRELRAIVGPHSRDTVYADDMMWIEVDGPRREDGD